MKVQIVHGAELFTALVRASGLDNTVANFTLRRLLLRVGVTDIDTLNATHLPRLLEHLRSELKKYLDDDEYEMAMRRLAELDQSFS